MPKGGLNKPSWELEQLSAQIMKKCRNYALRPKECGNCECGAKLVSGLVRCIGCGRAAKYEKPAVFYLEKDNGGEGAGDTLDPQRVAVERRLLRSVGAVAASEPEPTSGGGDLGGQSQDYTEEQQRKLKHISRLDKYSGHSKGASEQSQSRK